MIRKANNSFILLIISIITMLFIPYIFQQGLFMDGIIYATISHNMANDIGSLWNPIFSETIMSEFREHPPLAFGIQSVFYKLFGSGFYIEKIYSTLMALFTALFIILIWKRINTNDEIRKLYWLPVLFWMIIPRIPWSYHNNILENTMGFFSLIAVYVLIWSINQSLLKKLGSFILVSILLIAGFLTKGFPSLFPLGLYFLYFLINSKSYGWNKILTDSLALTFTFLGLLLTFLLVNNPALVYIQDYIGTQVFESLKGERVVVERWFIMWALLQELIIPLLITLIVISVYYWGSLSKFIKNKIDNKWALLFFFIGISATAPIMLSPKQLSFYMVPALPYFAISFSMLIAHIISDYLQRIKPKSIGLKVIQIVAIALLTTTIYLSVSQYGNYERDEQLLGDVHSIGKHIKNGSTLSTSPQLAQSWSLMSYLQRFYFISTDRNGEEFEYLLTTKNEKPNTNYEIVDIRLQGFVLLKKKH